jgi:rod shape determining protein RodA
MARLDNSNSRPRFDLSIFGTAVLLWLIGLALVYSATTIHTTGQLAGVFRQQILWVIMGVVVILLVAAIPTRLYYSLAYVFYGLSLLLLVAVLLKGEVSKGASRWISIAGFRVQPSEFAKIGLLFALARHLGEHEVSLRRIVSFVIPGLLIVVPFLLVLKQPDLGTAMVFCGLALPLFYWAGLSLIEAFFLVSPVVSLVLSAIPLVYAHTHQASLGFVGALPWGVFFLVVAIMLYLSRSSGLMWSMVSLANMGTATAITVVWNQVLKDYQKARIVTFIDPQSDAAGAGYQVIQSQVAIGSGHLFGKGYLQGTQTRLSYLPEQHTDFIFSTLGEQFGLMGCSIVLLIFLFLLARGFMVTRRVRNRFANMLVVGSVSIMAFHIFVNVAMTIGMMPVTGVPLPFLSYGGSFALTVAILVGLMINVAAAGHDF